MVGLESAGRGYMDRGVRALGICRYNRVDDVVE